MASSSSYNIELQSLLGHSNAMVIDVVEILSKPGIWEMKLLPQQEISMESTTHTEALHNNVIRRENQIHNIAILKELPSSYPWGSSARCRCGMETEEF